MILVKTQSGQQSFKDRHGTLTQRQRSAFILFDGKRTTDQVLAATAAMGITMQDVESMLEQGLLERSQLSFASTSNAAKGMAAVSAFSAATAPSDDAGATAAASSGFRNSGDRYQQAYKVATELTSGLGLRGLPLTLAVEAASGYRELMALAPKIRAAVGDVKFAKLDQALNG